MAVELCQREGMLQNICNESRAAGMMGTRHGYDMKHLRCVLEDNDDKLYFVPLKAYFEEFPRATVITETQKLKDLRVVIARQIGCPNQAHLLEIIRLRIIEFKEYSI